MLKERRINLLRDIDQQVDHLDCSYIDLLLCLLAQGR